MKIFEIYKRVLTEETINEPLYHGSRHPKLAWGTAKEDYGRNLFGYGIYLTTNIYEAIEYGLKEGKIDEGYLHIIHLSNVNIIDLDEVVSNDIKQTLLKDKHFFDLFKVDFNQETFDFEEYYYQIGDITYEWDYFNENGGEQLKLFKYNGNNEIFEKPVRDVNDIINIIKQDNEVGYKKTIDFEDVYGYFDHNFPSLEFSRDNVFKSYYYLYYYLVLKEKSMKKASNIFVSLGIDGIKTKGVGVEDVHLDPDDYIICILDPSVLTNVKTKKITKKDREINLEY